MRCILHRGPLLQAVVTEFAAQGNLRMYLRDPSSRLGVRGAASIAGQIVDAEVYLIGQCGILHRNLTTPAVLIFGSSNASADPTDVLAKLCVLPANSNLALEIPNPYPCCT